MDSQLCKTAVDMISEGVVNPRPVVKLLNKAMEQAIEESGCTDMMLPEFAPVRLLLSQLQIMAGATLSKEQQELIQRDITWCRAQQL